MVDIQTAQDSDLKISYPDGHKMETPLGTIDTYEGTVYIAATVDAKKPVYVSKLRALIQVQAC